MKFDLENLNPGVFFPFNDEDGGGVEVRLANGLKLDEINKKCSKKKVEFRKGARHEFIEENEEKRSELLWDYVIVNWKGIKDLDGNEIACTTENKVKLMRGSVEFATIVGSCIEKLSEEVESKEAVLEKNG